MPNYLFAIDTLQFSKRLQKAGLGIKVAEELAEAIKDSQTQSIEGLATKRDLREVRHDLKSLEKKIDQKFETLEYKLTVKMFVAILAATSIITWLDKII